MLKGWCRVDLGLVKGLVLVWFGVGLRWLRFGWGLGLVRASSASDIPESHSSKCLETKKGVCQFGSCLSHNVRHITTDDTCSPNACQTLNMASHTHVIRMINVHIAHLRYVDWI